MDACEGDEINDGDISWMIGGCDGVDDVDGVDGTGILPVSVADGTGILPVSVIDGNLFVTSGFIDSGVVTLGSFPETSGSESFPEMAGIGVMGVGRVLDVTGTLLVAGKIPDLVVRGCSVDVGCATPRIDAGSGPVLRVSFSI